MDDTGTRYGVHLRDDGPVRVVTLDRPEQRNALDLAIRPVLSQVFTEADADPDVRAVVLTGRDGAFCAGGDVKSMHRMAAETSIPRLQAAQRITQAIAGGRTPVVAAVDGAAVAAGLGLALACDRVVCSTRARFGAGFTSVGLAADLGITYFLPRRIGAARAQQMLMLGNIIDAAEASRLGLVDNVVEPEAVLATAIADARRFAMGPPIALGLLKRTLVDPPADLPTALAHEVSMQAQLMDTEDYSEGLKAFADKRKPAFTGR